MNEFLDELDKKSIPKECPKCHQKLRFIDAKSIGKRFFIWCPNPKCRFAKEI